jgi:hypothetical protein
MSGEADSAETGGTDPGSGEPKRGEARRVGRDRRSLPDELRRLAEIEREIESDASPVGIDAKKTHVMIIRMLEKIEGRLARLERADGE